MTVFGHALKTAHTFPRMQKSRQFLGTGKHNQSVEVIGHDHKTDAPNLHRVPQVIEDTEHDAFGLIEVEHSPSFMDGECDEIHVWLVRKLSSSVAHACEYLQRCRGMQALDVREDGHNAAKRLQVGRATLAFETSQVPTSRIRICLL